MDDRYKEMGYYSIVDAVYKEPACPIDINNDYIKAIPFPITDEVETLRYYSRSIPDFMTKCKNETNKILKRIYLSQITEVRFYLPFEQELEINFYESLLSSYRSRLQILDKESLTYKLVGSAGDGTNPGFSLLGYSGCGKSSAIKLLLSHYPQTIIHHFDNGQACQVLYLVVSCIPNSNFSALYGSIGRALDRALHVDIYEKMINKIKTLGGKQNTINDLIEKFAIGTIIFDEIQLIDFTGTKENTFESLMIMSNLTKVSMIVVGTEDSYNKIFSCLRTARRLGRPIQASLYCDNKEYVHYVVKSLFSYQLFDYYVKPDEDILNAFYEETKGIINMIVMLYIAIQDDYITMDKKPAIDGEFVRKTMRKHFGKLKEFLVDIKDEKKQLAIQKMLKESADSYDLEIDELRQQNNMKSAMEKHTSENIANVINEIVKSISLITKSYTSIEIEDVAKKIIGNMSLDNINITQVALNTYSELSKKRPSTKKSSKKSITKEEMKSFVLSDE